MKYLLLFILIFNIPLLSLAGDNYIYYNGTKILMQKDDTKLIVKIKSRVNSSIKEKIKSEFQKKDIKSENTFRDAAFLFDMYTPVSDLKLQKLSEFNDVLYAGYGYTVGDKVIHYPTDELIVKFRSPLSETEIQQINSRYGLKVLEKVELFDNLYLVSINISEIEKYGDVFSISNSLYESGLVEFAQPNFIRENMLLSMPNDSLINQMWHIKNTGNNIPENVQGIPGCDLNMDPAWNITTGHPDILIAIIDTGCDTGHVDLKPNFCEKMLWYDAYDNDSIPMDEYSHGTPMAGIAAAAGNNVIGTAGVAYNCSIMPVRVFGPWPSAYTTDLVLGKGLQWAWLHGASVLSNSWGGGAPSQIIENAITNARTYGRNGRGSVVTAGSGNDNNDTVYFPARMPGVIGVGGISPCNQRKSPSSCDNENWGANYGEGLSVVAPIPFIGTTLVLGGWCICATGTSSATPQISGIAGLIITKNIYLSEDSVRMVIEKTAHKVGNYSYNVQKENGLWNFEMGYGRPDAKLALDMTPAGPNLIFDRVPPIINIEPPESHVFENSNIIVSAQIYDNQYVADGQNAPRLYYYHSSKPDGYILGTLNNNLYNFILPEIKKGERIYYYIAAQDTSSTGNISTMPWGGMGLNPPGYIPPDKKMFISNVAGESSTFTNSQSVEITQLRDTTIISTLNFISEKIILDLNCRLNLDHTYNEDLIISLISPVGTEVILTSNLGGAEDNYTNTVFDDEAVNSIEDTNFVPPYTGEFKPVEKLWMFDGEKVTGTWKLKIVDYTVPSGGTLHDWSLIMKLADPFHIVKIPDKFELLNNYPNPFNPSTKILFNVPYTSRIKIVVYDISGSEVAVLLNDYLDADSRQSVEFNANVINGNRGISSGVYFYSMFADDVFIDSKRMVLLK